MGSLTRMMVGKKYLCIILPLMAMGIAIYMKVIASSLTWLIRGVGLKPKMSLPGTVLVQPFPTIKQA
jgi:hypothetical protein